MNLTVEKTIVKKRKFTKSCKGLIHKNTCRLFFVRKDPRKFAKNIEKPYAVKGYHPSHYKRPVCDFNHYIRTKKNTYRNFIYIRNIWGLHKGRMRSDFTSHVKELKENF